MAASIGDAAQQAVAYRLRLPTNAKQELATVTRVIDGDTIEVSIARQEYTVRYIGINTPETKVPQPANPIHRT